MTSESETTNMQAIKRLLAAILTALIVLIGFQVYWVADNEKDSRFENPTSERAKDLMFHRDWQGLLQFADSWVNDKPEESYALYYKGRAHFGLKQWQQAASTFEKLKVIEPAWLEKTQFFIDTCHSEIARQEAPETQQSIRQVSPDAALSASPAEPSM